MDSIRRYRRFDRSIDPTRCDGRGNVATSRQTQLDRSVELFVNDAEVFDDKYKRFLINRFRDLLPFPEVPIKLRIRDRQRMRKVERHKAHG